ncbi:hypothetical protein L0B52_04190 [Suttonella sp. R2A3]|uniref:hypothetical protein n=1 Tax=Suttonella sp. R2A3 TaxID=2908648 RepID=UPI001F2E2F76|nr:hypothetical protein [Suttonella sp. R2A3]UJF25352.1 hypothetical protein L0B52_04190 [Suttonella sp. R2A3]
MSKVIILNINSGKNTVETLQINTAGSEAVRIAAQNGVNYELIDAATQFAPENLTVLRQGDDLLIAFEGSLINEPDLIIEDYYQQSKDNPLIGLNEDGQYYAYVPEAGADVNVVTQLAEQMPSGQALGGDALFQGIPLWPLLLLPLAFLFVDDDDTSPVVESGDTSAPTQKATITTVVDDQMPQPGGSTGEVDVADGGVTNDKTPLLKGTLDAALADGSQSGVTAENLVIYASVNGAAPVELGNATVNGTDWSYQDETGYADTDKVVYTAKVVDAAGNEGRESGSYTITIDLSNVGVTNAGAFNDTDSDGKGDSFYVEVPEDTEGFYVYSSKGEELAFVPAQDSPSTTGWYLDNIDPQVEVGHTFVIRTIDTAGNVSSQHLNINTGVVLSGGAILPDYTLKITAVEDDSSGSAVSLTSGGPSTSDLALSLSGTIDINNLTVATDGMDPDKVHILVYDNGNYIGNAAVIVTSGDPNGTWTFDYDGVDAPDKYVPGSKHNFQVKAVYGDATSSLAVIPGSESNGFSVTVAENATGRTVEVNTSLVGAEEYLDLASVTPADVLQFQGDFGDVLDIGLDEKGWIETGMASLGGDSYHVLQNYDGSNYIQILVQDGITII